MTTIAQEPASVTLATHAGNHLARAGQLRRPQVVRVMLNPAGLRKMLREFLLAAGHQPPSAVEQDRARTGGALVEGEDVVAQSWQGLVEHAPLRVQKLKSEADR